jgi:chemotaxis protein MotB
MARATAETGEESGEGYFASISDLMVGILFIFLLMLTVFALNYREAEQEQVVALERYERLRLEAEQVRREAEEARRRAEEQEAEARRLAEIVRLALIETQRERDEAARQADLARAAQEEARRQETVARERSLEADALRARNERLQLALDAAIARLQQEIREREEARADLLARLATGLSSRGVTFRIDQQSGVLRLSEDVPFAVGRSDLTDRTRRTVQILAEVLGRVLPCFATAAAERVDCGPRDAPILEAVLIEGHTDQQGFTGLTAQQSVLENDRLSAARALSVFAELRRLQPPLDLLRNGDGVPLLGVSGYGERRPVAPSMNEAAFAQNRRIDLRFVLSSRTSDEVRRLIEQVDELRRVPP